MEKNTKTYYPYGLIGNCVSSALVSSEGSVDWMCMPYFDSPSLFARLLDSDKGGSFRIEGIDVVRTSQEYVRLTPILKTRIETRDGILDIYDFMPRFMSDRGQYYCPAEIHRSVRVISGRPKVRIVIDVRPNYGSSGCRIEDHGDCYKYLSDQGEYHSYFLYTDAEDPKAVIEGRTIELRKSMYLVLSYHQKVRPFTADRAYIEFERTKSYWLGWGDRSKLPARYREETLRSLLTLKLLMYQRTGAVIAAPTTSLPEIHGRDRNWDYRYCWIRDASMIVELFARLGHMGSSSRYMRFILDRMLLKNDGISVMYGIHGEKVLTEKTLDLAGYGGSRPVRVGNDAYRQKQNDLYGELLDAIYTYFACQQGTDFHFDQELWTAVRSLVNWSKAVWETPDNGIWEYRGQQQHHVFSKLMSWVAMDRGGRIAQSIGKQAYADECFRTAERIRADILEKGWHPEVEAFTMFYGSTHADAAVLLMLHYGFLPKDDPRIIKTVDYCYRQLVRGGYAMRYTSEDDFGKPENAFLICTYWMINALYLTGRRKEAREMFDHVRRCVNHLGLMSEGAEPETGRQTGNFPQGYSHMAFIQTALLLETDYEWEALVPKQPLTDS